MSEAKIHNNNPNSQFRICSVDGCTAEKVFSRGMCQKHYVRHLKHGDVHRRYGHAAQWGAVSRHPLYCTWIGMIGRCHDPRSPAYGNYGARGIFVCERWRKSFTDFLSDMGDRPAGMSIDRIDATGPYAPENCRWATRKEQRANYSPDGERRFRKAMSKNASQRAKEFREKGVCKRGHPLTPGNVYISPAYPNRRQCQACHKMKRDERLARKALGHSGTQVTERYARVVDREIVEMLDQLPDITPLVRIEA